MSQDIHGHAILERIIAAGGSLPVAELRQFAEQTYGKDATYHTCSEAQMSFDQLLLFLGTRNKISIDGERVTVHVENVCNHGDGHHAHSHG
jgi:probable metal-binding protein